VPSLKTFFLGMPPTALLRSEIPLMQGAAQIAEVSFQAFCLSANAAWHVHVQETAATHVIDSFRMNLDFDYR